ncbi:MAG: acylneuraminate cytidylyltransferase family protein, partial [Bacteroidales bacterium]|nr:acylneuraminate cytidylyltransferase family protein [Bacteroidales bacterium]
MDSVSFFLPARKGSQRVQNKNTRPFAGIKGGLLENKLNQLIKTKKIDEIILSTNDEECIRIAEGFSEKCSRLRIIQRPDSLCLDTTNLQDLIAYVPTVTQAGHILWGHVTTPIAGASEYDDAVELYFLKRTEGYDSLVSVTELKNFLLDKEGKIINNNTSLPWPRTQDLELLYEINHVMFITDRSIYEQQKNRIGDMPVLYIMDKLKSLDIDWEEDFMIAEM